MTKFDVPNVCYVRKIDEDTYQLLTPRDTGNWHEDIGHWDVVCEGESLNDLVEEAKVILPGRKLAYVSTSRI